MKATVIETVGALIEALQQHDPAAPVALAVEPVWGLRCTIAGVAVAEGTVFIAEGVQQDHLSAAVQVELAWARRARRPRTS